MDKQRSIPEAEATRMDAKRKKQRIKRVLINLTVLIVSAGVWCAAAYYGYTYAKDYIDTSIKNVQQQNSMNMKQLIEKMEALNQEIVLLREHIEEADSTISSSTSVQRRIDNKLEDLQDQLEELEKALRILKEAPNV